MTKQPIENPKKIRTSTFCVAYKRFVGQRKIEDRHYYYGDGKDHRTLSLILGKCNLWTVILYGNGLQTKNCYRDLPAPVQRLPATWEQLFFVGDKEKVVIYRGNPLGSGYRFTHGIMANAFAIVNKKQEVPTFLISRGQRGGLSSHRFMSLRVHGHDLFGNYNIQRHTLDRNIPEDIRIYGSVK